jgi:predicted TIM-barrel fold metal-dependent hydrolase
MKRIDAHLHVAADTPESQTLMQRYDLKYMNICVAEDAHGAWRTQADAYAPLAKSQPDRFAWCTTFDLPRFDDPHYIEKVLQGLEQDFADGAIACKIWKNFGMEVRHSNGDHILPNDPLLQPILRYIADRDKTLLMHIAEPLECWLPLKEGSPHYGYYSRHPEWHMYGRTEMPSHQELMAARDAVAAQNPGLRVVGAHFGSLEYDVDEVARRFERYPNFAVDISARLTDFALQDTAKVRQFCIAYQDRILWGTDLVAGAISEMPPAKQLGFLKYAEKTYREYTGFFESDGDVQVAQHTVKSLGLPDAILEKIYRTNAQRWYPGL